MAIIKLTNENFVDEVLKSNVPVLIDFYADWCGPCRMLGPTVEEIANERDDVKVCKVNVDEQNELAITFEIQVIPTLAVMKDGALIKKEVGVKDKAAILAMLGI
ncbi:MAG: thioredoxin [Ruminococcaceae bacterium]|nr:thioredoxin [Oscillospiraceae bacterium]